ncbi:MAG: helix-hairpin-helix domain-containing protein [Euryarchaeota archaeon]|nr:helix-hairpin-helix domain-containing protein [Euryarchaeota archaeon]
MKKERAKLWVPESRRSVFFTDAKRDLLSVIEGVGDALADILGEMGLTTYQHVANASVEQLSSIKGVSETTALAIKRSAKTLIGGSNVGKSKRARQPNEKTGENAQRDSATTKVNTKEVG